MQNSIEYDTLTHTHEILQRNVLEVTNNLKDQIKAIVTKLEWENIKGKISTIQLVGNNCDVLEGYILALEEWNNKLRDEEEFQELLSKYKKNIKSTKRNSTIFTY